MSKLTLSDLANLQSEDSAVQTLNENFQAISEAFDNTLSRDGTTPNQLTAPLDVNSQRILNLASPTSASDPVRLVDLQEASVEGIPLPSLTRNEGKFLTNDGDVAYWGEVSEDTPGGLLIASNNLSDLDSATTARTNLGLASAAIVATGTAGATIPLNNGNNTSSGSNTHTGAESFTGAVTLGGTADHRLTSAPTALSTDSIGFRGAPVNTQDNIYTFLIGDSGKMIRHTSGSAHAYTIPPSVFPVGHFLCVRNTGAGVVTLTRGVGVSLRIAGAATDSDKALAQWGLVTLVQEATNTWVATGYGIT